MFMERNDQVHTPIHISFDGKACAFLASLISITHLLDLDSLFVQRMGGNACIHLLLPLLLYWPLIYIALTEVFY